MQDEIDWNILLAEILKDMHTIIEETGSEIRCNKLPVVTGHHSRLKSLFQNLLSKAIKFSKPDSHPSVTITAKDKGKEWLFKVKDNGIGIEEIYNEKIFKIFQRFHSRKEYQGTGIGPAHCKRIIDLSGGQIWVKSEVDKGSSFYFTLPKTVVL